MFKLVVFDLDGVLVDTISSWVWVHEHFGVNNDASLTLYMRGEIDDREFMRRDIGLWLDLKKDITIDDIEAILARVPLMPGAVETLQTLRRRGIQTAIISGGLDIVGRRVADLCGVEHVIANGLACDKEGHLVGEGVLRVELLRKDVPLRNLMKKLGIIKEECAVVGNSHIDVPMFQLAGLRIAFNPDDETVQKAADVVLRSKNLQTILPYLIGRYF